MRVMSKPEPRRGYAEKKAHKSIAGVVGRGTAIPDSFQYNVRLPEYYHSLIDAHIVDCTPELAPESNMSLLYGLWMMVQAGRSGTSCSKTLACCRTMSTRKT